MNFVLPKVLARPMDIVICEKKFEIELNKLMVRYEMNLQACKTEDAKSMVKVNCIEEINHLVESTVLMLLTYRAAPDYLAIPSDSSDEFGEITLHARKEILKPKRCVGQTTLKLTAFPKLAEKVPDSTWDVIFSLPMSFNHLGVYAGYAIEIGNNTVADKILKRCDKGHVPLLLKHFAKIGSPAIIDYFLKYYGDTLNRNDLLEAVVMSIFNNKDKVVTCLLLEKLKPMNRSQNGESEAVASIMKRIVSACIRRSKSDKPIQISKESSGALKEVIAAAPNLFVDEDLLGGLKLLFKSLAIIESPDDHDSSRLSLRDSFVKFILEEELNWLVPGDPPRKVSTLPEKLLSEKNERLFIDLWPDIKRYCSEEDIATWELASLTSQDPDGEGPSRKQMFERARLSEELGKCSYEDYVKKVASEFNQLKLAGLIEGDCELQGDKAKKSKYLQSSSVLNLSEGPAHCSASHILKKLCMIPHLSLAAVNNQMTTLLSKCGAIEKRECFRLAAERGNIRMVECLLNAGVPVDDEYESISPICMAALCDRWEVVGKLINEGANPNVEVADGYTAFGLFVSSEDGVKNWLEGCKPSDLKKMMPDNMSIVGLLVNRLIQDAQDGKELVEGQLKFLKTLIRDSPGTFLAKDRDRSPIIRLFSCPSEALDILKLGLLAPGYADWDANFSQVLPGPNPSGSIGEFYQPAKKQCTSDRHVSRGSGPVSLIDKVNRLANPSLSKVLFNDIRRIKGKYEKFRTGPAPRQPEVQKIIIQDRQPQPPVNGRGGSQKQNQTPVGIGMSPTQGQGSTQNMGQGMSTLVQKALAEEIKRQLQQHPGFMTGQITQHMPPNAQQNTPQSSVNGWRQGHAQTLNPNLTLQ